jgi:phage shock protein B
VDMTEVAVAFLGVVKLATIFAFVLAIIWVRSRYGTRKREASMLIEQEQDTLVQLAKVADKMEQRLDTLEKILDAEHPKWKERM